MWLEEFNNIYFEVVRNGEFDTLGNVTSSPQGTYLTFATNDIYLANICKNSMSSCVIVTPKLCESRLLKESGKGIAVSENPKYAFQQLHNELIKNKDSRYITEQSDTVIGEGCMIHEKASVASKGVVIGKNVIIEENVIIREGVTIGDNCVIRAGAIIGYSACLAGRDLNGNLYPLISAGTVMLENNVQVGSYASVSKGLFPYEETKIGAYSLIGYVADISHNNIVGKNTIVLDQSQLCGNVMVGDDVRIAPKAIVSNRLKIEEKAEVALGAVVVNNVKKGVKVAGNFAIEHSKFLLWHRNKMRTK